MQAGSVFSRIAERIYAKHLVKNIAQAKDSTAVLIPDVAQGDITETAYVLKQLNVKSNSASIPYSFNPVWGKAKTTDSYVELSTAQPDKKRVPNVVGMGAKDAVYLLESYGMKVHLSGVGKVHTQSIPSGSMVRKGEYITLTLKN